MRALPYCAALVFTACSVSNPWFGLADSSGGSTSVATTADTTPTTDDPSAPGTTQDPSAPGTTTTTTNDPSAPGTTQAPSTESPSEPGTSSSSGPVDVTGPVDSSSSSTGGEFCTVTPADGFSDVILVDGAQYKQCTDPIVTFYGRLKAGQAELLFDTTDVNCNLGQNKGVLQLGKGYALTALKSECAKLVVYRGGFGPLCDIDYFFINRKADGIAIATGFFTPGAQLPNIPPIPMPLVAVQETQIPCCTEAATECCNMNLYGDYQLEFPMHDAIQPGEVVDDLPTLDGGLAHAVSIQNYTTAWQCPQEVTRRDFAATRAL